MIKTPWEEVKDSIDRADDMLTRAGKQAEPDPNKPYEFWALNDLHDAVRQMYELLKPPAPGPDRKDA